MKLKITLLKDVGNNRFIISEAGEMDLGTFAKLHEESYDLEIMRAAAQSGEAAFISAMRRRNLFPPYDLAQKLFQSAEGLFQDDEMEQAVVEYEDIDALPALDETPVEFEDLDDDDDDDEIGDLLKDDSDDLSEDDIKEIDSDDDTPRFMPDDDSEHEN